MLQVSQSSKRRSEPAGGERSVLDRPVANLQGVGPRIAERLARLGVYRYGDLACLLPVRYEDRTEIRPLGTLRAGEKALVEGELELSEVAYRRRRSLLCRIADGTGAITLRFFHFSRAQQRTLTRGSRLRCFGEVRVGPTGLEMVHPEYRMLSERAEPPSRTLTPVYPSTEGLHQQRLRDLARQVLAEMLREPPVDYLSDCLPATWPSFVEAVSFLHGPPPGTELATLAAGRHPCQRRIALEELIAQRASLRRLNMGQRQERAQPLTDTQSWLSELRTSLPFQLTSAQQVALTEIVQDLERDRPMLRLLQGDVGSGKTILAAFACALAASSASQSTVMAPTELLAEQHFANFSRWLEPLGIELAYLTGSVTGNARALTLARIAAGTAQVVIGTHALFSEGVSFHHLALVVVDEQHRFGVHQRLELKLKGERGSRAPHQLVMTATPIPRTLAMTAYADLDCSVIDELPPGRLPVRTAAMPQSRRAELVGRVLAHCKQGQQAYWVCPLIEESDTLDSQAALALERELSGALVGLSVALLHGRMKSAEKERVMRAFKEREVDVLVATTVIEVGVDVPNATLMVIESSERMGLAQLHQLRGRVGRGEGASSCVLLYKPPLSELARERLRVMRETNDGFRVAEKDLELRGPGEVLGTRQTGVMSLRIADLVRDADLLPTVIEISETLLQRHPDRIDALMRRWVSGLSDYGSV